MSTATQELEAGRTTSRLSAALQVTGWVSLAMLVASIVLLPLTAVQIVLATVATVGLASDRRFGPLPAAVLVMLAAPYDRAANILLPRLFDIPVRPQDAALVVGLLLSVPRLRGASPRMLRSPLALTMMAFLAVGVIAMLVGLLGDNSLRDILRDGRWWALYAGGLLALLTRAGRPAVVRAIVVGTTIFAVLIIAVAALPAFEDALKWRALEFDRGLLRMQFGNSAMLLVTLAISVVGCVGRPRAWRVGWTTLLSVAIVLSLTRTFIVVAFGVLVLAIVAALLDGRSRRRPVARPAAAGLPIAAMALGVVLAIGLSTFAATVTAFTVSFTSQSTAASSGGPEEDPLDRLLLQSPVSDLGTLGGGRFETYRRAVDVITSAPLLGQGLGALVVAEYTFGGEEFDTPGKLPNVDDAWLTVGMKSGIVGIVTFALMYLLAVMTALRGPRWPRVWLIPAWLGILALMTTQSFATTGYGPFVLGLLAVVPLLANGYTDSRVERARAHE